MSDGSYFNEFHQEPAMPTNPAQQRPLARFYHICSWHMPCLAPFLDLVDVFKIDGDIVHYDGLYIDYARRYESRDNFYTTHGEACAALAECCDRLIARIEAGEPIYAGGPHAMPDLLSDLYATRKVALDGKAVARTPKTSFASTNAEYIVRGINHAD